jgi:hypothetical protein
VVSPNLIRMSGLAATLAGASFIVAELLTPTTLVTNPDLLSEVAATNSFLVQSLLTLFAAMLLLGGLVGLYAGQSRAAGRLGVVGFLLAYFGTTLMMGNLYTNTFVTPFLAVGAPDVLNGTFAGVLRLWLPLAFGFLALTWVLFAVATVRAKI